MTKLLKNKKILIAGAGGLLGGALVSKAISEGATVIAVDLNLDAMKARFSQLGVDILSNKLILAELNITNNIAVIDFFKSITELDGAVNATYPRNKTYGSHFFDVTFESFNENVSLHLGGAFIFTQQCAAYFKRTKKPFSLVNISSVYGVVAPKFDVYEGTSMTMPVEYAAIKSAILHLNKYVVAYINSNNFRINSVSPGGIEDGQPEAFLERYKKNTHGKGMLDVTDTLGSVLFFLSEQSKYITGQNLIVDDGYHI